MKKQIKGDIKIQATSFLTKVFFFNFLKQLINIEFPKAACRLSFCKRKFRSTCSTFYHLSSDGAKNLIFGDENFNTSLNNEMREGCRMKREEDKMSFSPRKFVNLGPVAPVRPLSVPLHVTKLRAHIFAS